jgi:hypothetical protein
LGKPVPCAECVNLNSLRTGIERWGNVVIKLKVLCAVAGLALMGAGCATPQQQVSQKEDLLAAAGFPVYLYADPLDCTCVYFGTQQNWDAYKQEMFAKQLADEAQMTAIMNQDTWDMGPWGWP